MREGFYQSLKKEKTSHSRRKRLPHCPHERGGRVIKVIQWIINNKRLFIVISIWILVGIGAFIWYGIKFGEYHWGIMSGFATWTLAGGVFLVLFQIQETRKSTNAQVAVELFRELRSEEIKDTLRFVYSLDRQEIKNLFEMDKKSIEQLMDRFEFLGALVNQGIVDKRLAIEAFAGPPALKCWYQLASYMRGLEKQRGFYVVHYEDFVRSSLEYFKKYNINIMFTRDGDDPVNLMNEFQKLIDEEDELRPRKLKEIRREKRYKKGSLVPPIFPLHLSFPRRRESRGAKGYGKKSKPKMRPK